MCEHFDELLAAEEIKAEELVWTREAERMTAERELSKDTERLDSANTAANAQSKIAAKNRLEVAIELEAASRRSLEKLKKFHASKNAVKLVSKGNELFESFSPESIEELTKSARERIQAAATELTGAYVALREIAAEQGAHRAELKTISAELEVEFPDRPTIPLDPRRFCRKSIAEALSRINIPCRDWEAFTANLGDFRPV